MWPESFLIADGQQELRVKVFCRLWKLNIDFAFLVTKVQTVLFSDRFQTERKSAINIYLLNGVFDLDLVAGHLSRLVRLFFHCGLGCKELMGVKIFENLINELSMIQSHTFRYQ